MKLSVITINYNNAVGLLRTLDSITPLKTGEWEYIVIDGGSTDESVDIIKRYEDKINYWISESDSGIYNAMNKGIRQSKGEYVLFINSGDTIHSQANINKLISELSGEDIVYFDLEIVDIISNTRYVKTYPNFPDFKYFSEDTLPHSGSFIRKQVLIDYGYYSERMKITSDWAFFMDSICINRCTYKHIDGHFSTFYLDGISSDERNRQLVFDERNAHIASTYPLYNSLYRDWVGKRMELYKLKTSVSVRTLKKLGFLKWLKM